MTRFTRLCLAVALPSLLAFVTAQGPTMGIGYVDSQYLISLHPAYQQIIETSEMANAEMGQVATRVQELQQKQQAGTALTEQEQELLQVSIATLQTLQDRYDSELQALREPAILAVDAAISEVARSLNIGIVFDSLRSGPGGYGVIVYADPAIDLTPMVEDVLLGNL